MTWPLVLQGLGLLVTVAAAALAGWVTLRDTTKKATTPPYDVLVKDVGELREDQKEDRQRIEHLERDRWVDRTFITNTLDAWPRDRPFTVPWAPEWVSQRYGMRFPQHPPTPGSVLE